MALTHIIDSDYTIQIHKNNKLQYSDPSNYKKAEAILTITGGGPTAGQTISLKATNANGIDTTSLTYTAHGSQLLSSRKFNVSGTNSATADSLKACIEHSSGHDGLITVTKVQDSDDNWTLVLQQTVAGPDSNWGISNSLSNVTHGAGFTGGELLIDGVDQLPFRFDFLGAPNLRGQTANKRYKTFLGEQKL